MLNQLLLILSIVFFLSCNQTTIKTTKTEIDNSYLSSINYMQTSAEVKALYYQTFNFGKLIVDKDLTLENNKKRAIIVDVDETLVITIPYNANNMMKSRNYPNGWKEWIDKIDAKPIPGAIDFLKYVDKQNITIFYITNRKENVKESTYKSLKKLGYPIEIKNLLMKTDSSNKSLRRNYVLKDYRVVLYIGDSLIDFPGNFDKEFTKNMQGRDNQVKKHKDKFGTKWLILPNSVYGDWENVIFNYNWDKSLKERIDEKRKVLIY